jgi:hypothetical protein
MVKPCSADIRLGTLIRSYPSSAWKPVLEPASISLVDSREVTGSDDEKRMHRYLFSCPLMPLVENTSLAMASKLSRCGLRIDSSFQRSMDDHALERRGRNTAQGMFNGATLAGAIETPIAVALRCKPGLWSVL